MLLMACAGTVQVHRPGVNQAGCLRPGAGNRENGDTDSRRPIPRELRSRLSGV